MHEGPLQALESEVFRCETLEDLTETLCGTHPYQFAYLGHSVEVTITPEGKITIRAEEAKP